MGSRGLTARLWGGHPVWPHCAGMVGSQGYCPLPTPLCPPFDPVALPLSSGRKSRVACQEPGAPGNYVSCKHGPSHWPLSEQAGTGPGEVHTQIQSGAGAPRLQPRAPGGRALVSPLPWPTVGLPVGLRAPAPSALPHPHPRRLFCV